MPDAPAADLPQNEKLSRSERLGRGSVTRLIVQFSLPAIVGMITQALYNFIDRVFVGRAMGDDAIAGITVCFPFMLMIISFGMLIGFGGAALISIRLGENRRDEAERILGNVGLLLPFASLFVTAAGLIGIDPILRLLGANEAILPFAHDYMWVILLGTIFQIVGFGLNAIIRAEGNPRVAMITMLVSVFINILLAPPFIFRNGWPLVFFGWSMPGFGWGMRGAAWATVCAQAVSAVWVLWYFIGGGSTLKLRYAALRLDGQLCRKIMIVGSPPFFLQFASCTMQSILNRQLDRFGGVQAISIIGIIFVFVMLIFMPIFGLNHGIQPIIGYNYGAKKFDRVKRTLVISSLLACVGSTAGFALMMLIPEQIVRFFDPNNEELAKLGAHAMRISMLMLPIVGVQVISAGYFQAVGKPKISMLLSLSRQVLLLIPAVLILPHFYGLDGVWAALPTADAISSIITLACLFFELRHLQQRHEDTAVLVPADKPA
jgi:putative MATE family efflux protein